ncbi:MAG: DUF6653 family protein [Thainema sp.]
MFAQTISSLFQMEGETWKRHTHPWCFWTRLTVIPLLFLAIWSRLWLGWWSLPLIATALLWNWLNARIFPVPKSTHTWMAKGVLGERVWINRAAIPIPQHHQYFPYFLTGLSGIGLILAAWGLWQFNLSLTLAGTLLINIGKIWFFDRMVWLYEDMKAATAEYKSWLY